MERWTIKDLNSTSDLDFAIRILSERRKPLNPYSPLGSKLSQSILFLEKLRDAQNKENKGKNVERGNTLAGGYILLSTYATLTDEEAKALRDTDETPTAVIAVKKDWLEAWIKPEYATLEEFLDDYTFDTIANLSAEAELEGELAFEYRDGLDDPFLFPNGCSGDAMLAFVDFLSGKLQENGHEEASKYLDCHDELAFEYRDGLDDSFLFSKGCSGDAMLVFADFLSGKLQENGHEEASKYLDCLLSL